MLTHPTVAKLEHMRLFGMANALRDQLVTADIDELTFTDRLALMVDNEMAMRESRRLAQRLGRARLKHQACVADLDYGQGRGLDKHLMLHLASCQWVRRHQNIVITGATGVGKSYLACALAHKACPTPRRHCRLDKAAQQLFARQSAFWRWQFRVDIGTNEAATPD